MREIKITFYLFYPAVHFTSYLIYFGFDFFGKKNTKKTFHGDGLFRELSKETKKGKEGRDREQEKGSMRLNDELLSLRGAGVPCNHVECVCLRIFQQGRESDGPPPSLL